MISWNPRMSKSTPHSAECPECHLPIPFAQPPTPGSLLLCPHCETILKVVADPPAPHLTWGFEEPLAPDERAQMRPETISRHWRFLRNSR